MSTQYSKVTIAGHPIHPMLIAFPVTFYTTTLIAFIVYAINGELSAWQIGLRANVAGVITAFVAALPGFIDWARGIPKGTQAKATGRNHMILNLAALALFVINLIAYRDHWHAMYAMDLVVVPNAALAIVLSALGVACTLVAGALGWTLVQTHHVGVDLTTEQQRLDTRVAVNKRNA
jgi:uncharacterized membrane protein